MKLVLAFVVLALSSACSSPERATGTPDGPLPGEPAGTAASGEVDVPEFEVIALQYAEAPELAATIQELMDDARQGAADDNGPKILTDPRTNSLLVMATQERMVEIRNLVGALDVEQKSDAD